MFKKLILLGVLILFSITMTQVVAQNDNKLELSIQGTWNFKMDPQDLGVKESWFNQSFSDKITLPASMTEKGLGDPVTLQTNWTASLYDSSWYFNPRMEKYRQPGNLKFPFFLTPVKYYVGAAWYQKEIKIPSEWTGKRVLLSLERVHWESTVWVDGKSIGMQNSLSTPHQYSLAEGLTPGKHIITIRVDNRIKEINPGRDSHSLTDQTQGNWNGIVGKMNLTATTPTYFEDVRLFPSLATKSVYAIIHLKSTTGKIGRGTMNFRVRAINSENSQFISPLSIVYSFKNADTVFTVAFPMGAQFEKWDEFNPICYQMNLSLKCPYSAGFCSPTGA